MGLQAILDVNGVFLKKINRFVKPSKGFNVIATANTKGQGSDDGKFIGTNILNEAFLERFPITIEQAYPTNKIETKILLNVMSDKGLTKSVDTEFATSLVTWADIIRKTYYEGGVDELISTRRLVHIVEAFSIFKNKMKAIEMCTNRFDLDTKTSFLDLYTKIDGGEDVSSCLYSVNFPSTTPSFPSRHCNTSHGPLKLHPDPACLIDLQGQKPRPSFPEAPVTTKALPYQPKLFREPVNPSR